MAALVLAPAISARTSSSLFVRSLRGVSSMPPALDVSISTTRGSAVVEKIIQPVGESPSVNTIRNIIRELETGERTAGNIDMTMQIVEPEFGIAYSHLQGGSRVVLPVADRSLYIPGG